MLPFTKQQKIFIYTYSATHFLLSCGIIFMDLSNSHLFLPKFESEVMFYLLAPIWPLKNMNIGNSMLGIGALSVVLIGLLYGWVYVVVYKNIFKK